MQGAETFAAYLDLPVKRGNHLTFIVRKCKDLAVSSINLQRSTTAADEFFGSINTLLGLHMHLQQGIFLAACASAAVHVAETAQAKSMWRWAQASKLMQALCERLGPYWTQLNGYTAVTLLQCLVKCHVQHGPMRVKHLDAATEQVAACTDLNQQGVSLAAWSCATLFERHEPTKYYSLLGQLADQALHGPAWPTDAVKLQHSATVIWSMARSHYMPPRELLLKLTEAACCQLGSFVPYAAQDIEMLFLGYAWLGHPPSEQAMQDLVGHFLKQRLRSHEASNMAWALAVLGQLNMPLFTDLLAHISRPHLEDVKICRQLHTALEYLRPEIDVEPEVLHQWQQTAEYLHKSWPYESYDKKTRVFHREVLNALQDGLQLKCKQDVDIAREHDHSLFSIDILIREQPGVPRDIAVAVDGRDHFMQNGSPDR